MILQTITLGGWRCFWEEIQVGPLTDGLNVIHAPNGSGKSTLFEALCRGLLDSHTVSGQDIQAIQPWGRDLSPKVTVEFLHQGIAYRIAKQFLAGAYAILERKEEGRFRPLAEGRQADQQVRRLISRKAPGRGLSQPQHWGLAQALWAPQGRLALQELSGDLVADIRSALGMQLADPAAGSIESAISKLYHQYFTGQGRLKSGKNAPRIVHLQKELELAKERRNSALELLQRYEETSRQVEELRGRRHQMQLESEALTEQIRAAKTRAGNFQALQTELKHRHSAAAKAMAQHQQLKQHFEHIKVTAQELAEKQDLLALMEAEAATVQREVQACERAAANARQGLEKAREGAAAVYEAEQDAHQAAEYIAARKNNRDLLERIERAEHIERNLALLKQERLALVAPDPSTMKAIRKAQQARDEAFLKHQAAMITLEIVPQQTLELKVVAGEQSGSQTLAKDKPVRLQGAPELVVDLIGIARVRASGPVGDVSQLRQELRQISDRLDDLIRPYGTADVDLLETMSESAAALERQSAEAQKQLDGILGTQSLQALKRENILLASTCNELEKAHPAWQAALPDCAALQSVAEQAQRRQRRQTAQAEELWQNAHAALAAIQARQTVLRDQEQEYHKMLQKLIARLGELTHDGLSENERTTALAETLMAWDAAKTAVQDLECRLKAFGNDPSEALVKLEARLSAIQETERLARDNEMVASGSLALLASQGPYSILVELEEKISQLEQEIDIEQVHIDAVQLLHDTVVQFRRQATAAVVEPVRKGATRILQRIAGPRLGEIDLEDGFVPAAVRPETAPATVSLANLSGGEQEQLYLSVRLALADVMAREERQLVVMDDVLTSTDAGRLGRVMSILEESAQRLQLLILTCHPERYRILPNANFIDFETCLR